MKVPYDWLSEFVQVSGGPEEVAQVLVMAGFPVDGVEEIEGVAVLEVDVPSNRPDALSILGIAREVAAAIREKVTLPKPQFVEGKRKVGDLVVVDVQEPTLCPRYIARAVTGIKVGPAPDAMQKRIRTIGLRPVNNIVDITNYVLYECGQPLHAFDHRRIGSGTIVVRQSKPREKIKAIDGKEYVLPQGALLISDPKAPVAIAGVMGGLESEIKDDTTTVVIESALFDAMRVRLTSRALGMSTDSSLRFERQVDYHFVDWASRRSAQLMAEIGGGEVADGSVDADFIEPDPVDIDLRPSRVPQVLGIDVEPSRIAADLERLGFKVRKTQDLLRVRAPHWRRDVKEEIDLVEEIARTEGYDSIPTRAPMAVRVGRPDRFMQARNRTVELLKGCGAHEAVSWSFLEEKQSNDFQFWSEDEPVTVVSPDGTVDRVLRRSVIPSLLLIQGGNEGYKEKKAPIFEVAKCYQRVGKEFGERFCLSLVDGRGFRYAKGALETVLNGLRIPYRLQPADVPSLVEGRSCEILMGDKRRGFIGEIEATALESRDVSTPGTAWFEIDFDEVMRLAVLESEGIEAPGRFLPIRRDIAVVVDDKVSWGEIETLVRKSFPDKGEAVLKDITLFDLFRGKSIPQGQKSVALSVTLMPVSRPLQAEEIESSIQAVVKSLEKVLGAQLRA